MHKKYSNKSLEVEKLYKQFAIAFILQLHSHIFGLHIKFMFSKKATKIEKIFTLEIDGEDLVFFCGSLRKHELYKLMVL